MFHEYKPCKNDTETLYFSSCFVDDEDIEFADKHRMNVLYTETRCTDTFELISKFIKRGYELEIIECKDPYPDLPIEYAAIKYYAKFIHPENYNKEDYKKCIQTSKAALNL